MRFLMAGIATVAALVIGVPAQAQSATAMFDRSCCSPGEVISQSGSGFTPGGQLSEFCHCSSRRAYSHSVRSARRLSRRMHRARSRAS